MIELVHKYGKNIHIFSNAYLSTFLTELSQSHCVQPRISHIINVLYSQLLGEVINLEFPVVEVEVPTRMTQHHSKILLKSKILMNHQKTVVVNLARAGTLPSQICYENLNYVINPSFVRQDHIMIARTTDSNEQVVGSSLGASKIGGDIDNAILLFPDPMGATGNTIISVVKHYKEKILGKPFKFIALHLIVTPEYLKKVSQETPDLVVYSLRVDRGLSPDFVLYSIPGTSWDQERGLNDKHYIVPGAGGLGEVLNNSFV